MSRRKGAAFMRIFRHWRSRRKAILWKKPKKWPKMPSTIPCNVLRSSSFRFPRQIKESCHALRRENDIPSIGAAHDMELLGLVANGFRVTDNLLVAAKKLDQESAKGMTPTERTVGGV